MVAAAIGAAAVATVGSAAITSSASKSAANTQAQAAQNAAQEQWDEFNTVQANEAPYMALGQSAITPLLQAMGYNVTQGANGQYSLSTNPSSILQQQFTAPTLQDVRNTPGYQFQMEQGNKAINNSAAARGGLLSGATLKDLLSYSQGLADTTYQQDFNNSLTAFNTNYNSAANNVNRLSGLVTLGQNTAANVGNQGLQTASNAGQLTTSGANASAAGTVASGNAISSGLSGLASSGTNYALLNQLTNQGTSSYSSAASTSTPTDLISSYTG
ncbi:hypothetical protein [Paraburkholderia sp. C35]|uniref:hypothetical protein n=1 Tax=Paraburkholderia sp. C35 TaxID=2126993 RepID=UPI000D69A34E|nr:hypothetical protein [Paraburkholderia sp. C35]